MNYLNPVSMKHNPPFYLIPASRIDSDSLINNYMKFSVLSLTKGNDAISE